MDDTREEVFLRGQGSAGTRPRSPSAEAHLEESQVDALFTAIGSAVDPAIARAERAAEWCSFNAAVFSTELTAVCDAINTAVSVSERKTYH